MSYRKSDGFRHPRGDVTCRRSVAVVMVHRVQKDRLAEIKADISAEERESTKVTANEKQSANDEFHQKDGGPQVILDDVEIQTQACMLTCLYLYSKQAPKLGASFVVEAPGAVRTPTRSDCS
jgi:hypothetical protein